MRSRFWVRGLFTMSGIFDDWLLVVAISFLFLGFMSFAYVCLTTIRKE